MSIFLLPMSRTCKIYFVTNLSPALTIVRSWVQVPIKSSLADLFFFSTRYPGLDRDSNPGQVKPNGQGSESKLKDRLNFKINIMLLQRSVSFSWPDVFFVWHV
jgi:hypothetical protein